MTAVDIEWLAATAHRLVVAPPDPRLSALAAPLALRALKLMPGDPAVRLAYARELHFSGRNDEALAVCDETLVRHPHAVEAHLLRCAFLIPPVSDNAAGAAANRAALGRAISGLAGDGRLSNEAALVRIAAWAGRTHPFYLAYLGENDVGLMRPLGSLLCRAMAAAYPDHRSPPTALVIAGEPLRVGIVSSHFHRHSNWKGLIRGWVAGFDPGHIRVFGYALDERSDACTDEARQRCFRFETGERPFEAWCQTIRADRLHALIYPEIGEHPLTARLAMLRLAAVQCVGSGRCVTSGLPTIDYFLGSAAMEPVAGETHYSERLVRLPDLGYPLTRPTNETMPLAREHFGFRETATLFLSPHALWKYLPQYDELFPRIAERIPDSQFVFFDHRAVEEISRRVERRICKAFTERGLDPARHVRFLKSMRTAEFNRVMDLSDIYLDSIGWNGCMTTVDALCRDLPVVTLTGPVARSRMGMAFLRHLGIAETVAGNPDEYVETAVRLAADPSWRQTLRNRIAAAKSRLFDDAARVQGLASFLETAIRAPDSLAASH